MKEKLKSIYDVLGSITISGADNMNRLLWAMQSIEKLASEAGTEQEASNE